MVYLIDGYNLLHAMGILRPRMGPAGLECARRRLLAMLHAGQASRTDRTTVVFDAAHPPPGVPVEQTYHDIQVLFAVGWENADDLIEQMIRKASAPRQLVVVSDDHRIQRAARRRRCTVQSCADYMDLLARQRPRRSPPPAGESKPAGDTQYWLDEFADLQDDPEFKELFEPFDFEADSG
jgi:hypothetical protein